MPRLLSEVPAYLLTAISGIGLLLFAHFIYVLFKDSQYEVILVGLILIFGGLLVGRIRPKYSRNIGVGFVSRPSHASRNETEVSINSSDSRVFKLVAGLGAYIGIAILPMLGVRWYTADEQKLSGSLSTRIGEYRCEKLPDESDVCLNTNSFVHYTFSRDARNVELLAGEASFVVRRDKNRPFDVLSGDALIHDISTSFDVYKKRGSTQVTVIDGLIRVVAPIRPELRFKFDHAEANNAWKIAPEFHKLQQLEFDDATRTLRVRSDLSDLQLSQRLAWRKGRIDLTELTLGEALDEFSRYQPDTSFEYSDKSLSHIRVAGSMGSGRLDDFLYALEHEFHIRHTITKTGEDTVITLSRQR